MAALAEIRLIGFDKFLEWKERFMLAIAKPETTAKLLSQMGMYIQMTTYERTFGKGEYFTGSSSYSHRWRRFRQWAGKLPVDHVYLSWTGGMWKAMTQEANDQMVRIFFSPTKANDIVIDPYVNEKGQSIPGSTIVRNITNADMAYELHRYRNFFLMDEKQMDHALQMVVDYVADALVSSKPSGPAAGP